jgi:hypothetical protein
MRGKKPYWSSNGLPMTDSLYITTLSKSELLNKLLTNKFIEEYYLDSEKAKGDKVFKKNYKIAKVTCLASLYGATPGNPYKNSGLYGIFKNNGTEMPIKDIKNLWNAFWDSLPDVANFRDSVTNYFESCSSQGKPAINGFGFVIPSSDSHKAFNYTIQSSLSCWIREFLNRMEQKGGIDFKRGSLICVIHDEIICEVDEDFVDEYKRILYECEEEVNTKFKLKYPLKLGFNIGKNFYDIH